MRMVLLCVIGLAAFVAGHLEARYSDSLSAVAIVRNVQNECQAVDTDSGIVLGVYAMKDGRCGGRALREFRLISPL